MRRRTLELLDQFRQLRRIAGEASRSVESRVAKLSGGGVQLPLAP